MSRFPGTRRLTYLSHAQAIVRRGEAVAISMVGEDFEPQSADATVLRSGGHLQDCGIVKKCP
jgi:hypothetical protein